MKQYEKFYSLWVKRAEFKKNKNLIKKELDGKYLINLQSKFLFFFIV